MSAKYLHPREERFISIREVAVNLIFVFVSETLVSLLLQASAPRLTTIKGYLWRIYTPAIRKIPLTQHNHEYQQPIYPNHLLSVRRYNCNGTTRHGLRKGTRPSVQIHLLF